eukprot:5622743-Amphidinium_carterae.1
MKLHQRAMVAHHCLLRVLQQCVVYPELLAEALSIDLITALSHKRMRHEVAKTTVKHQQQTRATTRHTEHRTVSLSIDNGIRKLGNASKFWNAQLA